MNVKIMGIGFIVIMIILAVGVWSVVDQDDLYEDNEEEVSQNDNHESESNDENAPPTIMSSVQ